MTVKGWRSSIMVAVMVVAAPFLVAARAARAAGPAADTATFAIIVGVNRGVDPELKPLLYADDDAARYQMLFHSLGARTVLLTRADANTSRVLPVAIAEARTPDRKTLAAAVATLAIEVKAARSRGLHTSLYFLFAGHGNVNDGRAYLALEDARLTGDELDRTVLRPIGAEQAHVIVDACYSYYLARERGAGGVARMVRGFSESGGGLDRPDVGLLLSTSSGRESHEWDGFQAGVFSHEVRSGLYGAADVNGDGQIDYREIAAFIVRANAAIPNDRLRPDVFARPPQGQSRLIDLRPRGRRVLVLDAGLEAGHYLLEDRAGNRLVEFHGAPNQTITLIRPEDEAIFLRQLDSGREYELGRATGEVHVSALTAGTLTERPRGAAHHAFSLIFSLPFDVEAVAQYHFPATVALDPGPPAPHGQSWRPRAALAATVVTGLAAGGTAWFAWSSRAQADQAVGASQADAAAFNQQIEADNRRARWMGAVALASAGAAVALWFWPETRVEPVVAQTDAGRAVYGLRGRF